MAINSTLQTFSCFPAGAAIPAFTFVKVEAGQVVAAAAGEHAAGVLQADVVEGQAAIVAFSGISKVLIGGAAVTLDADVTVDADGKAVTSATGNAINGQLVIGGAANSVGSIFLQFKGATA